MELKLILSLHFRLNEMASAHEAVTLANHRHTEVYRYPHDVDHGIQVRKGDIDPLQWGNMGIRSPVGKTIYLVKSP